MRVYIAGKVSGEPIGETFVKFNKAEYRLRKRGMEVVNPMRLCSSSWSWEQCMRVCLAQLVQCDAIYLLSDWAESRGAITEYYVAQQLNLKILK